MPCRIAPSRAVALALAVAVSVSSHGHAQAERWRNVPVPGYDHGPARGWALLSDVDGDGVRDLASNWKKQPNGPMEAQVALLSGSDLTRLATYDTDAFLMRVDLDVFMLADIGDVNGDGVDDLAIGAPDDLDGRVDVIAIPSGELLLTLRGSEPLGRYGASIAGLGDVDGDGASDFAVATAGVAVGTSGSGRITLHSGADGAVLHEWLAGASRLMAEYGFRLASTIDRDGDGIRDLHAAILPVASSASPDLVTFSSASLTEIARFTLPDPTLTFGELADFDGDGIDDVIVGGAFTSQVISGADGSALNHLGGYSFASWDRVFDVGDLDGDGLHDCGLDGTELDPATFHAICLVEVRSSATGALLFELRQDRVATEALACDDADGDHRIELALIGLDDPGVGRDTLLLLSAKGGTLVAERPWTSAYDSFDGGTTFLDDFDGDRRADLVCFRSSSGEGMEPHPVVVLSSNDGSLLAAFDGPYGLAAPGGPLLALPDVDGDGRSDFVTGNYADPGPRPLTQVRSGADGRVITSITSTYAWTGSHFGVALAAGANPATGAIEIAIGEPYVSRGVKGVTGRVSIHAIDGALLRRLDGVTANDHFGSSVAWLGDLDGDSVSDWAVGAPDVDTSKSDGGRVSLVSGATGIPLRLLSGAFASGRFGAAVAAVPDADNDGLDDLLVGEPGGGPLREGMAYLHSSATGALLASWKGSKANEAFGRVVGLLPDLNHDGAAELVVATGAGTILDVISPKHGRLLFGLDLPAGGISCSHLAAVDIRLAGLLAGQREQALAFGSGAGGSKSGTVVWCDVGDLFLDIDPPSAAPGETVTAAVRGGPAGAYSGIYVARIDDLSFDRFLLFGFLDTFGEWNAVDVTPPGLSGMTYLLRAYALGFDGRLASSTDHELVFE